jgi:hypothetical protein
MTGNFPASWPRGSAKPNNQRPFDNHPTTHPVEHLPGDTRRPLNPVARFEIFFA